MAAILTRYRKSRGVSIPKVAERLGWSVSKTGMNLRGERAFYLHDIVKVSDALGVGAWQVVREAQETCAEPSEQIEPPRCEWCDGPVPLAADGRTNRRYCCDEHAAAEYNARQARARRARKRACLQCGGPIPATEGLKAGICSVKCRKLRRAQREHDRY